MMKDAGGATTVTTTTTTGATGAPGAARGGSIGAAGRSPPRKGGVSQVGSLRGGMVPGGSVGVQWVVIQHVLLEKESHIIHNLQWSPALETCLRRENLLPDNREEKHSVTALIHCVLDHLHMCMEPGKFVLFCQCLAQHGNTALSEHLWGSFRMTNTKVPSSTPLTASRSMDPASSAAPGSVSKENTTVLRGKLHKVQGEADKLRSRMAHMEDDQQKMSLFVTRAMDFEDEVTVKLGTLEDSKDLLRTQLSQREQGLELWRKKEKEYLVEIHSMQQRMDEMARLIRAKDGEIIQLHRNTDQQQEQIQLLHNHLTNDTSKKHPHFAAESTVAVKSVKRSKQPIKLPTIVKVQGQVNGQGGSLMSNSWDPTPWKAGAFSNGNNNMLVVSRRAKRGSVTHRDRSKPLSPIEGTPQDGGDTSRSVPAEKRASDILKQSLVCSHQEYICNSSEKWLDAKGGVVDMPNLHVTIPPDALKQSVCVTVIEIQQQAQMREMIDAVGLSEHVEPALFVELQPHGLHFEKEVYLELKGQKTLTPKRLLVFHKDRNFYKKSQWTDISAECSPRTHKQNVVLTLGQFCTIQAFRLLTAPMGGSSGPLSPPTNKSAAGNFCALVSNMLNEETLRCQFHVFYSEFEQKLEVLCLPHKSVNVANETFTKDALNAFFKRGLDYLGQAKTTVSICQGEVLQFYLDDDQKLSFEGTVSKDVIETKGQLFSFNIDSSSSSSSLSSSSSSQRQQPQSYHDRPAPVLLTVRRKLISTQQNVCSVKLFRKPARMMTRTMTRAVTEVDGFGMPELQILYDSLLKKVIATVDVRLLLEDMKKEDIFRPREFEQILSEKTPHARAKMFLDILSRKGHPGLASFCAVLEGKHQPILEQLKHTLLSSMSTESMP